MGIDVKKADITGIDVVENGFLINGKTYTHLILATGTVPNQLGKLGERYFIEDPSDLVGKKALLIGGGDLAFDNALSLHDNDIDVTILHRGRIKANRTLVNEVYKQKVQVVKGDPVEIEEEQGYYSYQNERFDELVLFIGRTPCLDLLQGIEHLKTHLPSFRTSVKGLYVIGDAALGDLSQTALASGSGLAAAMDIAKTVKDDEDPLRERAR